MIDYIFLLFYIKIAYCNGNFQVRLYFKIKEEKLLHNNHNNIKYEALHCRLLLISVLTKYYSVDFESNM